VTLADGTTLKADLIIGADGIHSVAVKSVIGYDNPAVPKGMSCFRFLLSSEELIEDPETEALMENHEGKARYYVVAQGQSTKRIVWYPCREYVRTLIIQTEIANQSISNQMQNIAIIIPDKEGLDSQEGTQVTS
jgi:salicylate hydroxylase